MGRRHRHRHSQALCVGSGEGKRCGLEVFVLTLTEKKFQYFPACWVKKDCSRMTPVQKFNCIRTNINVIAFTSKSIAVLRGGNLRGSLFPVLDLANVLRSHTKQTFGSFPLDGWSTVGKDIFARLKMQLLFSGPGFRASMLNISNGNHALHGL